MTDTLTTPESIVQQVAKDPKLMGHVQALAIATVEAVQKSMEPETIVLVSRPPIIPNRDYVFEVEIAQEIEVRQGHGETGISIKASSHSEGLFILAASQSQQLKTGSACFYCSASGKQNWSFNVEVEQPMLCDRDENGE